MVGLGGIGSNAAHVICSMGVRNLTLIDPDTVEEENVFPGFFEKCGSSKVSEVARQLTARFDVSVTTFQNTIQDISDDVLFGSDIIIVSTDNMRARWDVWDRYREQSNPSIWYIDGRMGGTVGMSYAVNAQYPEVMSYFERLDMPEHDTPLECGEKATASVTKGYIAGFIGLAVTDIVNGKLPLYFQRFDIAHRTYVFMTQDDVIRK